MDQPKSTPGTAVEPETPAQSDAVTRIVLTRPALDRAAKERLLSALRRAGDDERVRAVVITGTGRAFCVGQDLAEHATALHLGAEAAFETLNQHYEPIIGTITAMDKPVIAAINGSCAGAGLAIALACDVRVATAQAKFATAFTGIGLGFDSGLSASLARAVGYARASELIMVGDPFTARQALDWGLIGRVVDDDWDAAVAGLAERLAAGPTAALAAAKRELAAGWSAPAGEVLALEGRLQRRLGASVDHQGAVEAFLAKRRPTFTGKN